MADAGDLKGEQKERQVDEVSACRLSCLRAFRAVMGSPSVLDTQMDTCSQTRGGVSRMRESNPQREFHARLLALGSAASRRRAMTSCRGRDGCGLDVSGEPHWSLVSHSGTTLNLDSGVITYSNAVVGLE